MPKAVKGERHPQSNAEPTAHLQLGVLVECDPSIKAIILKIDSEHHDYIVEDLDDQTLVVKESKLRDLKSKLELVSGPWPCRCSTVVVADNPL